VTKILNLRSRRLPRCEDRDGGSTPRRVTGSTDRPSSSSSRNEAAIKLSNDFSSGANSMRRSTSLSESDASRRNEPNRPTRRMPS
jgi:hypothetical protein